MKPIIFIILVAAHLNYLSEKKQQSITSKIISMKLNAGIITSRLKETKSFYQNVLRFDVSYENDWYLLMRTPSGSGHISFLTPNHPKQRPIFQKAFEGKGVYITIEVEDVDEIYKEIKDKNIPIEIELRDESWGDRHFAVVDPNGIGIDIVKYTPQ